MVPSRVAGATVQSSSSSGIFFQVDKQSQDLGNYRMTSNFGSSSNSFPGHVRGNMGAFSGDASNTVLNSVANSGPSVGASSLVTDANSGLSGGPHLQRSSSVNTESYMRLPASPMSFSSNNISISGSMDGSSVVQQSSHTDLGLQQVQQSQQHQGASSVTSLPRMVQVHLPVDPRIQDPTIISQLHKKPRLDNKQDDVVQQHVLLQLLQRQDPMLLHNPNPQLQALIQQQRLRQQEQQLVQGMPSMQQLHLLQQQQQLFQLRQQLQVQGMQPSSGAKRTYDDAVCSRRLMQYLYHQRRPTENTITYWRNFVNEYYSPRAKKRWCLSLYGNVGQQLHGLFPQSAMDVWQCGICGSKCGRGFETTFEVLPRLNEINFASGVVDELLFVDFPKEYRFSSGIMVLEYAKAVQESVYEHLRVVREGQLRICFTPELKILSWEFCAQRHEELLPRRLVAPPMNQLLQVAQKCQSTISGSGADGISKSGLQANNAMIVMAGRQLARSLELPSLNDLGFSKIYMRCLQIADVVNSMGDLMDFCREHNKSAIEGLKSYPRNPKINIQKAHEMNTMEGLQCLPTDHNTMNKLLPSLQHPTFHGQMINNHAQMVSPGALSGSAQTVPARTNFHNMLMRQNPMNSTRNPSQAPSSTTTPGPSGDSSRSLTTPRQQNLQMHSPSVASLQQQSQSLSLQSSQALQQQMIQQLLQDRSRKNNGQVSIPQKPLTGLSIRNSPAVPGPGSGTPHVQLQSRSNSFTAAASSNSGHPAPVGQVGFGHKVLDPQHNPQLLDEMGNELTENGFLDFDLDDSMNFRWKA